MKLSTYFLATALLLSNSVAQAGVIVGGTRVIYNGDKKETSLHLKNPDKSSYLIQSWVDGDPQTNAKAPFIITPLCSAWAPLKKMRCALFALAAICRQIAKRCTG